MKKNLNKKGFTLIELIVVIAILAILALILVPSITGYIAKAESAKKSSKRKIRVFTCRSRGLDHKWCSKNSYRWCNCDSN